MFKRYENKFILVEPMKEVSTKASRTQKAHLVHGKRKMLQLRKREELSHNIHYISKVPVGIVMDRDFLTVSPDDPLSVLIQNLRGEETSAVVVDEEGKLLGFVTMKDLLHFFEPPRGYSIVGGRLLRRYSLNRTSKVKDIMVRKPVTIKIGENLGKAIKLMLEAGKHHLPVVDDENRVHGVLEVKDIIRLIRIVSS